MYSFLYGSGEADYISSFRSKVVVSWQAVLWIWEDTNVNQFIASLMEKIYQQQQTLCLGTQLIYI
jgi:flagellar biosynthesis chaperone FliJ